MATEIEKFRFRIIAAVIIAIKIVTTAKIEKFRFRIIIFLVYNVALKVRNLDF